MKHRITLLLSLLLTFPIYATDFAGNHLVLPIAGRTAGALGSQWKTDLYLTNMAGEGERVAVTLVFVNQHGTEKLGRAELAPRETVAVPDAIRFPFLQDNATGHIRLVAESADARIAARARIYNTGAGRGEFGQTVQAEPIDKLTREAFLTGLSGTDGNRTNVGITNPADHPVAAFVMLHDASGESRSGFSIEVAPRSVYLLNDVFSHFQNPPASPENASVRVTSSHGVYAYASIVRAGSGDADFIPGTAAKIDDSNVIVAPQCSAPAKLGLASLPAPGWIVLFDNNEQPHAKTAALESRHNFKAKEVYLFGGFYAPSLTQSQIAALRCEPTVRFVEQNSRVPLP